MRIGCAGHQGGTAVSSKSRQIEVSLRPRKPLARLPCLLLLLVTFPSPIFFQFFRGQEMQS